MLFAESKAGLSRGLKFSGHQALGAVQGPIRCLHNGFLATWFGLMIGTFRATAWREFWSFRIFHSAPHCAPRRTRRRMNTGRMRAPPLYRQMRQSCPSIKGASCERAWKDSPPSPVATATAIFPQGRRAHGADQPAELFVAASTEGQVFGLQNV
jgi:hypothetical protein